MTGTVVEQEIAQLLEAFTAKVTPLGVRVERVATGGEAAAVVRDEAGANVPLVAAELATVAPGMVAALGAVAEPTGPAATRDAPLGVSLARLAIAETGSVLLAEETLEDRALGLLTQTQVVVCPTAALVPSLNEAAAALREVALRPGGGYATLVTGPSRTADIERALTVGVQGPGRVVVVFVDELG